MFEIASLIPFGIGLVIGVVGTVVYAVNSARKRKQWRESAVNLDVHDDKDFFDGFV